MLQIPPFSKDTQMIAFPFLSAFHVHQEKSFEIFPRITRIFTFFFQYEICYLSFRKIFPRGAFVIPLYFPSYGGNVSLLTDRVVT